MKKLTYLSVVMVAMALLVVGCSQDSTTPYQSAPTSTPDVAKFTRPSTASAYGDVTSATMYVYVSQASSHEVFLHRITSDWDEATVTWTNFGGAYAAGVEGSFTATATGWYSVDVTGLVQSWMDGTYDNFGILLEQGDLNYPRTHINSKENAANHPYLEVCLEGVGCADMDDVGDAYIYELYPSANTGAGELLNIGWYDASDLEKQALIRFELPTTPELAALGDFVWLDMNNDGIQDAGEPGVAGVTVNLYDCEDTYLATMVTDANGYYLFDELTPGDYYVEFIAPAGYVFSPQDQGADDAVDSDADQTTGMTICTTLDAGETDLTWDAGLYMPPPPEGCTRTIGYWKTHDGYGPQADEVTQYLPIWLGDAAGTHSLQVTTAAMSTDVLEMKTYGKQNNGITKLYAQLLGAKLNMAAGADYSVVADAIMYADAFLADHDYTDWDGLSDGDQMMVLGWQGELDEYNNGFIGPGHCDDDVYDDMDD
jgi:hypothetical protein